MNERYLIDEYNPDAGIGHSMGILNRAIKIAQRNHLELIYSEKQLQKSSELTWKWRLHQTLRLLKWKKLEETHNIGDDLNTLLRPADRLLNKRFITASPVKFKIIDLPIFDIPIPSNDQNDDDVYRLIDQFIQNNPEPNVIFKVRKIPSGDYEYGSTRDWFLGAYKDARQTSPIPNLLTANKLNIAVHIRRGDLLPGRQFNNLSSRMIPDAWYLGLLKIILSKVAQPIAIHIFSEGKNGQYQSELGQPFSWVEQFPDRDLKVIEHIDSSFLESFNALVHADILVGSKSGMSHLGAVLNQNIKIMPKMWHSYRGTPKVIEIDDTQHLPNERNISPLLKELLDSE